MLFPTWNYIPQNAPAGGGYLELIQPPVCVTPEVMTFDPGGTLTEAVGVKRAAELLGQRSERSLDLTCVFVCLTYSFTRPSLSLSLSAVRCDVQVCVSGQVSVISPLLLISGRRFFCLILSEGGSSAPVLIMVTVLDLSLSRRSRCSFSLLSEISLLFFFVICQEGKHQYWQQCVCVGQNICISAVRVCSLRGWAGHRVLSVTARSRLHPHMQLQENSEDPESHPMDTDSHTPDADVTSHVASCSTTSFRKKHSTLISYKVRLVLFTCSSFLTVLFLSVFAFSLNLTFLKGHFFVTIVLLW